MNKRVITQMVMPTGWHLNQPFKGSVVRIEAGSYEELLAAVQDWRIHNGVDQGDVKGDIDTYICETYPRQCQPGQMTVAQAFGGGVPSGASGQRFVDRIINWLAETWNKGAGNGIVSDNEAAARSSICATCTYNRQWETGCAKCVDQIERMGTLLRQNRKSAHHHHLWGCRHFNHDNRTAVFMKLQHLNKGGGPGPCWCK